MKILIVDDDTKVSRLLRITLSRAGHGVHVARTGVEGLDEIKQWAPDLILADIGMSNMSGCGFCKRVRERSQAPILVLSAQASPAVIVEALDAGADDYVKKPFSVPELQARVRGFVRRSPAER